MREQKEMKGSDQNIYPRTKYHGLNNVIQIPFSFITQAWILEKTGLLASVEDPGADLSSVITLQRRLNTIERDIAAVPTKVGNSISNF